MKKRTVAVVLAATLAFSMFGCGKEEPKQEVVQEEVETDAEVEQETEQEEPKQEEEQEEEETNSDDGIEWEVGVVDPDPSNSVQIDPSSFSTTEDLGRICTGPVDCFNEEGVFIGWMQEGAKPKILEENGELYKVDTKQGTFYVKQEEFMWQSYDPATERIYTGEEYKQALSKEVAELNQSKYETMEQANALDMYIETVEAPSKDGLELVEQEVCPRAKSSEVEGNEGVSQAAMIVVSKYTEYYYEIKDENLGYITFDVYGKLREEQQ